MRKPSRLVELEDIISSYIIHQEHDIVGVVLHTHLALEAILIEIIQLKKNDNATYKLSFPDKTKWLVENNLITHLDKMAFDEYNNFRNDFAHIFGHIVTTSTFLELARKLEGFGVDFSDSMGHYKIDVAEEYYDGSIGVLAEVSWCILFHAAEILNIKGGRDIFSGD